jgi:photosystem II stability/assembly factor-like uncharacterized protein
MDSASGSDRRSRRPETWIATSATPGRREREVTTLLRGVRWASIRDRGLGVQSTRRSIGTLAAAAAALVIGALLTSRPASAQDTGWVLQGEGGLVTALVLDPVNPAILYATTARGIFKTIDGGASWRPQGGELEGKSILAMAIDPRHTATIFATTDTGGIYRSRDGGEHWSEANAGLAARYVGSIAVDPASTLWAGTEAGRIFKSADGGDSWKETVPPTAHISVMAITPDPVTVGTLYVGTNSEGVYKTVDGGTTWTHMTNGLKRATVWNILVDKSAPSTVYAGTHEGFYRSANGGGLWTPGNKGLTSFNILALAVDPASPSTLYAGTAAGVFQTSDAGGSWRSLYPDLYATAIALDPSTPTTLYAGTHLGVMKTQDKGARWSPLRMAGPPPELAAQPLPPLPLGTSRPRDKSLPQLPVVVQHREGPNAPAVAPKEAAAPAHAQAPAPAPAPAAVEKEIEAVRAPSAAEAPRADRLAFPSMDRRGRDDSPFGPDSLRRTRPWDIDVFAGVGGPRGTPGLANGPDHGLRDPVLVGHPERTSERVDGRGEVRGSVGSR